MQTIQYKVFDTGNLHIQPTGVDPAEIAGKDKRQKEKQRRPVHHQGKAAANKVL